MAKTKKKGLSTLLVILLLAVVAIGGMLAYLTDRDSETNVFTVGDVAIDLVEDYEQGSKLAPGVEIKKEAYIENTGTNDAWVWMTVAVPADVDSVIETTGFDTEKWTVMNEKTENINGINHIVYTYLYKSVLPAGEETALGLTKVCLDSSVDYVDGKYYTVVEGIVSEVEGNVADAKIYVSAYAIQGESFETATAAYAAYGEQWGDNGAEYATAPTIVKNDAELKALIEKINTTPEYWNKEVVVSLGANTYSADYAIKQYPEWNGVVGAGATANNMAALKGDENYTNITFKGAKGTVFTGNVTVNGFGNAGNGFSKSTGTTTFENITFDAANSPESNGEDSVVMYVKAAANDVHFVNCTFKNATHVTVGGSAADGVGSVSFNNCTFDKGGCISGYAETIKVVNSVIDNQGGFINKSKAGKVTVDGCEIVCGKYAFRTANSGIKIEVKNSQITVNEYEGEKNLVNFRGSNESATFTNCDLTSGYTVTGEDANSVLTIK